jgi:hypothetical protein
MVVDPNIHFRVLNPHLETEGLPRIFTSEATDTNAQAGYAGASSFGFAGANARIDVWAKAIIGPHAAIEMNMEKFDVITNPCPKCLGPMCFICGAAVPSLLEAGKHVCSLLRGSNMKDYEYCSNCYEGEIRYGSEMRDTLPWNDSIIVMINGTWNGLTDPEQVELVEGEDGHYSCTVKLGDTGVEYFNFLVHGSPGYVLYPPPSSRGVQGSAVLGPDANGSDIYWKLDGAVDGASPGTVYRIDLTWSSESNSFKSVSWAVETSQEASETCMGANFQHKYFLKLPWGTIQEMTSSGSEQGLHEASFMLPMTDPGAFSILRDNLPFQQLYPESTNKMEGKSPIRGPGTNPSNNGWKLKGVAGDKFTIELWVAQRACPSYALTLSTSSGLTHQWLSESSERHGYYVTGSFNNWHFSKMQKDKDTPGVYRYALSQDYSENTLFQIAMDRNHQQALYPALLDSPSGYAIVTGPDDQAADRCWLIQGDEGSVEITLDLNQADRRKTVTWEALDEGGMPKAIEG